MSNITAVGTYTGNNSNSALVVKELKYSSTLRGFVFSGDTAPTSIEIGIIDEAGTFVVFTDGTITAIPDDFRVLAMPNKGLAMKVTGGSPDFIITALNAGHPHRIHPGPDHL